ncbi:unnamed protein product [Clavelina lepadiformis]|uniref:Hydroxysteroid dehydrogenase-like protein 2 n=1 Tax=Clavelina lepadiformis TaxID=159417 RepID=A0ABP0FSQ3_CLALP
MENTGKLAGYTLFVTGGSRGIGKSIALKAARDGANIVIAAKTAEPHPKLPGTIYTAAKEIEDVGGKCLPCIVDVRDEKAVQAAVDEAVRTFGGIDILVNNASAISLTGTLATTMKKYDLMNNVNTRGTFLCSRACLPHLLKSKQRSRQAHILNISPPISSITPKWFKSFPAYSIAKYGMSLCVLGMAAEFEEQGIAVNALWPRTTVATAATEMLGGSSSAAHSRKTDIMADAAYAIFLKGISCSGNFLIDDEVLAKEGITDLDQYACVPGNQLSLDIFVNNNGSFAPQEKTSKKHNASRDQPSRNGNPEVSAIFNEMRKALSASVVAQIGGVVKYTLSASGKSESWTVDLKNGSGSIRQEDGKADCTLKMSPNTFVAMFKGEMDPTDAFMSGKIKIDGDMGLVMKLEKLTQNIPKSKL